MAIYHFAVKALSRSTGQSAVAAAAYRAGDRLRDERTGKLCNFSRRHGVLHREILLPVNLDISRTALWNCVEAAERRSNSTIAREYEIALPDELKLTEQIALATSFTRFLMERYAIAADVAVHSPNSQGDQRNYHAHILTSTRVMEPDGTFGDKVRILDSRETGPAEILKLRELFAEMTNAALAASGLHERVDHRSHAARRINSEPGRKIGVGGIGYERRTGEKSDRRSDLEAEREAMLQLEKPFGNPVVDIADLFVSGLIEDQQNLPDNLTLLHVEEPSVVESPVPNEVFELALAGFDQATASMQLQLEQMIFYGETAYTIGDGQSETSAVVSQKAPDRLSRSSSESEITIAKGNWYSGSSENEFSKPNIQHLSEQPVAIPPANRQVGLQPTEGKLDIGTGKSNAVAGPSLSNPAELTFRIFAEGDSSSLAVFQNNSQNHRGGARPHQDLVENPSRTVKPNSAYFAQLPAFDKISARSVTPPLGSVGPARSAPHDSERSSGRVDLAGYRSANKNRFNETPSPETEKPVFQDRLPLDRDRPAREPSPKPFVETAAHSVLNPQSPRLTGTSSETAQPQSRFENHRPTGRLPTDPSVDDRAPPEKAGPSQKPASDLANSDDHQKIRKTALAIALACYFIRRRGLTAMQEEEAGKALSHIFQAPAAQILDLAKRAADWLRASISGQRLFSVNPKIIDHCARFIFELTKLPRDPSFPDAAARLLPMVTIHFTKLNQAAEIFREEILQSGNEPAPKARQVSQEKPARTQSPTSSVSARPQPGPPSAQGRRPANSASLHVVREMSQTTLETHQAPNIGARVKHQPTPDKTRSSATPLTVFKPGREGQDIPSVPKTTSSSVSQNGKSTKPETLHPVAAKSKSDIPQLGTGQKNNSKPSNQRGKDKDRGRW